MKVLLISPTCPEPTNKGERIRVSSLYQALSAISKTDLIYPEINRCRASLRMFCALLQGKSLSSAYFKEKNFIKKVKNLLSKNQYQKIIVVSTGLDFLIPVLKPYTHKIIWDFIDQDSYKWEVFAKKNKGIKKWLYKREAENIKGIEKQVAEFAKIITVVSENEKNRLEESLKRSIDVVSIHTEKKELKFKQVQNRIIFTGTMSYQPNVEAVIFFHNQVFKQLVGDFPDLDFTVIGRNPSPQLIKECSLASFTGEVTEITPYLESALFAVIPVLNDIGLPTKVLEAMSFGIPLVVSKNIQKVFNFENEKQALIAETTEDYLKACKIIIKEQDLRKRLVQNAFQFLEDFYSLKAVKKQLKGLLP